MDWYVLGFAVVLVAVCFVYIRDLGEHKAMSKMIHDLQRELAKSLRG